MQSICRIESPVGRLTVAAEEDHVTGLWLEGQKYYAATLAALYHERETLVFARVRAWLDRYFAGEQPADDLPLAPAGSEFRQSVWAVLLYSLLHYHPLLQD